MRETCDHFSQIIQTGRIPIMPIGNSERPVHNFPENQILTFLWKIGNQEQAWIVEDRFASNILSILAAVVEANSRLEADLYRVKMANGMGNLRNFQRPEKLPEIYETNFRKLFLFHSTLNRNFRKFWSPQWNAFSLSRNEKQWIKSRNVMGDR